MKRVLLLATMMSVAPLAAAQAPNQLPNPGFENGASGWKMPQIPNFKVVDDVSHGGAHSLRISNTDPAAYLLASQNTPLEPGRKYRFGVWIRTRDVKGGDTGATICLEWLAGARVIGGIYLDGRKGDQEWFHLEGLSGPIPAEATSGLITLYLRHGMTGTAWFDDVTLTEEYAPALEAAMLEPNYRGRLADGQHVLVRVRVGDHLKGEVKPGDCRLVLSVSSGDHTLSSRTFASPNAGVNDLALDPGAIGPGDYRLGVSLLGPTGEQLGAQEFELHKPAAGDSLPAVYIDEHNRTMVAGRPYFPLGWYFGPAPSDSNFREHIDRIAASPFNTIMCYGINGGSPSQVRRYLDYLDGHKLKLIYSLKDVYAGTSGYEEPVLGWKGEENIVSGVVQMFRDHPAILAWYVNDELPLTMRDRLEARQRRIRELDPNHPTWALLNEVTDLSGYLNTADILGTDPYPLPEQPVTMAAEWTKMSSDATAGLRPLWMVPQAFDKSVYLKSATTGHPPTLGQEMVMSYLCLIHGANGLIYYSYFDLQRDRAGFANRWADMLVVGREIQQLEPALLSIAKPPSLTVTPSGGHVQYAVRADDQGNTYVMLANSDASVGASVRVTLPANATAQVLHRAELHPGPQLTAGNVCVLALGPMDAATLIVRP